jgi:hypothetical protein
MSKIVPRPRSAAERHATAFVPRGRGYSATATLASPSPLAALATLSIDRAVEILAGCVQVDEAKKWRTTAEMLAVYEREMKGSKDAEHHAQALWQHADRRVGELRAGERIVTAGRPKKSVTGDQISEGAKRSRNERRAEEKSRAKAAVPAKKFATTIGEARAAKRSPDKAVAKLIAKPKRKAPIEAKPVVETAAATWTTPTPADGYDERSGIVQVCREMGEALDAWPSSDVVDVVTVRKALSRWQGLIRG